MHQNIREGSFTIRETFKKEQLKSEWKGCKWMHSLLPVMPWRCTGQSNRSCSSFALLKKP